MPSNAFRVTRTHLTLCLWIIVKSQFQREEVIFKSEASHVWPKTCSREWKKIASLRAKNDVSHAIQLKLHKRTDKTRFEVIVTSYGRNKNLDEMKKPIGQ